MADYLFNALRAQMGLGYDFTSATVRAACLVENAWVPDVVNDTTVQHILGAGATVNGARITLASKTVALSSGQGLWDCADIAVTGVSGAYAGLLIYTFITDDTLSYPMLYYQSVAGTGAGTVTFTTPNGILKW